MRRCPPRSAAGAFATTVAVLVVVVVVVVVVVAGRETEGAVCTQTCGDGLGPKEKPREVRRLHRHLACLLRRRRLLLHGRLDGPPRLDERQLRRRIRHEAFVPEDRARLVTVVAHAAYG